MHLFTKYHRNRADGEFPTSVQQKNVMLLKRAQILTQSLFSINNGCGSFCKYWNNNWTFLPISAKLQNAIRYDEKFTSIKEQCANLLKFLNSSWSMNVARIIWTHRAEIPVQIGHGRISTHISRVKTASATLWVDFIHFHYVLRFVGIILLFLIACKAAHIHNSLVWIVFRSMHSINYLKNAS